MRIIIRIFTILLVALLLITGTGVSAQNPNKIMPVEEEAPRQDMPLPPPSGVPSVAPTLYYQKPGEPGISPSPYRTLNSSFIAIIFGFILIVAALQLASLVFTILMIIDCARREFKEQTLWLVIMLVGLIAGFGFITALVYYFAVKRPNIGTTKKE